MKQREQPKPQIEITRDGPYLVKGGLPLSQQLIVTCGSPSTAASCSGWRFGCAPTRLTLPCPSRHSVQ